MLSDNARRYLSFAVFGCGIFGALPGCGVWAEGALDTGVSVSLLYLVVTFANATPILACAFALWHRAIAGWWLVFAGLCVPLGLAMSVPRARPALFVVLIGSLPLMGPSVAVGLFAILTDHWNWPKLLGPASPTD
jgi:hypothetical protein